MNKVNSSIRLTHFMVRSFYLILVAVFVLSIVLSKSLLIQYYVIPLWITMPVGFGALVCLDKLMCNFKKNIAFDLKNIRLLNLLSIFCFIASAIAMISFIVIIVIDSNIFWTVFVVYAMFPIMSIGEAFVGLIVRVVKSSFEKAIEIKSENDLTI